MAVCIPDDFLQCLHVPVKQFYGTGRKDIYRILHLFKQVDEGKGGVFLKSPSINFLVKRSW